MENVGKNSLKTDIGHKMVKGRINSELIHINGRWKRPHPDWRLNCLPLISSTFDISLFNRKLLDLVLLDYWITKKGTFYFYQKYCIKSKHWDEQVIS